MKKHSLTIASLLICFSTICPAQKWGVVSKVSKAVSQPQILKGVGKQRIKITQQIPKASDYQQDWRTIQPLNGNEKKRRN